MDRTDSFGEALVLAVNLGDDADTTGAVTGQLAGALYGVAGMPQRWLDAVAWRPSILEAADKLLTPAAERIEGSRGQARFADASAAACGHSRPFAPAGRSSPPSTRGRHRGAAGQQRSS